MGAGAGGGGRGRKGIGPGWGRDGAGGRKPMAPLGVFCSGSTRQWGHCSAPGCLQPVELKGGVLNGRRLDMRARRGAADWQSHSPHPTRSQPQPAVLWAELRFSFEKGIFLFLFLFILLEGQAGWGVPPSPPPARQHARCSLHGAQPMYGHGFGGIHLLGILPLCTLCS
jgi:hypothetical protein